MVFREILGRGRDVPETTNERLQAELAAALDRLVAGLGARVELIPFRTRGSRPRPDDDARAGEDLASQATTGVDWTRHPRPRSAAEFGQLAAGLDLVIAVRLHGAVLGSAAGRPVVGIAYDAKTTGYLTDLGLPEQALRLSATADEIEAAARRTLADPTIIERTCSGVAGMRARTRLVEPALAALAGAPRGLTSGAGRTRTARAARRLARSTGLGASSLTCSADVAGAASARATPQHRAHVRVLEELPVRLDQLGRNERHVRPQALRELGDQVRLGAPAARQREVADEVLVEPLLVVVRPVVEAIGGQLQEPLAPCGTRTLELVHERVLVAVGEQAVRVGIPPRLHHREIGPATLPRDRIEQVRGSAGCCG